jgi:hypothetical protein
VALREQLEGIDVAGSDDREVGAVEGQNLPDAEALGHGDDAGVRGAEGQVGVALDELRAAFQVLGGEGDEAEGADGNGAQDGGLGRGVARVERK